MLSSDSHGCLPRELSVTGSPCLFSLYNLCIWVLLDASPPDAVYGNRIINSYSDPMQDLYPCL